MRELLAFAALVGCAGSPRTGAEPVSVRRVIIRAEPCLAMPPPAPPELSGDARIDTARKADAYDALALWTRLYAIPACLDPDAVKVAADP